MLRANPDSLSALAALALLADYLDEDEETARYGTTFANEERRKRIAEVRAALRIVGKYAEAIRSRPKIV